MSAALDGLDCTAVEAADLGLDQSKFDAIVENIAVAMARMDCAFTMPDAIQRAADREMADWYLTIIFNAGYVPTPRAPVSA